MSNSKQRSEGEQRPAAGDLLDRQYHDIGIPAVAATLRYLHPSDDELPAPHADRPTAGKAA